LPIASKESLYYIAAAAMRSVENSPRFLDTAAADTVVDYSAADLAVAAAAAQTQLLLQPNRTREKTKKTMKGVSQNVREDEAGHRLSPSEATTVIEPIAPTNSLPFASLSSVTCFIRTCLCIKARFFSTLDSGGAFS
jgi:hypothetical protein